MQMKDIPFGTSDGLAVEPVAHPAMAGQAFWCDRTSGDGRAPMAALMRGCRSDPWCATGHGPFRAAGSLTTGHAEGRRFERKAGKCHQVADAAEPHRPITAHGATLFVVD